MTKSDIKINIVYDDSPEAELRLFEALKMLISEEDILQYLNNPKQQNITLPINEVKNNNYGRR